jgi:hypothetical protein
VNAETNFFNNISKALDKLGQLALVNALLTRTVFCSKPDVGLATEKFIGLMERGQ